MAFDILVDTTEGVINVGQMKSARVYGTIIQTSFSGSGVAPVGFDRAKGTVVPVPVSPTDTRLIPGIIFSSARNWTLGTSPNPNSNTWCDNFIMYFIMVD